MKTSTIAAMLLFLTLFMLVSGEHWRLSTSERLLTEDFEYLMNQPYRPSDPTDSDLWSFSNIRDIDKGIVIQYTIYPCPKEAPKGAVCKWYGNPQLEKKDGF